MKPELKRLHSPDVDDLRTFVHEGAGAFSVFVQAMIGPAGDDAAESFDFLVCSPEWIRDQVSKGPILGMHHVIMATFDYEGLVRLIRSYCERCDGQTWQEVASRLSCLGRWEFEGYKDSVDSRRT